MVGTCNHKNGELVASDRIAVDEMTLQAFLQCFFHLIFWLGRCSSLSLLPPGISLYSNFKRMNTQSSIRSLSAAAVKSARNNGVLSLEIEFPPLLGGQSSKSALDDYTNIDVLDANRDWTIEFIRDGLFSQFKEDVWVVFGDETELQLALDKVAFSYLH